MDISQQKQRHNEQVLACVQNEQLKKHCQHLLSALIAVPDIFLTGRNSVQLEFEKQNGRYLEFELHEDRLELLFSPENGIEETSTLSLDDFSACNRWIERFLTD